MRKQTKIAALVSAAALLAIGASMTSLAAGWNSLGNGDAEYLDSDGYRVTQEWKKYTDGKWYYLKDDGLMARNELVPYGDYLYCVNDDGSRVLGEWRYFDNTEGEEVNGITPGGFWYYFDASTGRAKTGGLHTIDSQKFRFTEEGRMITDWYTEDNETYYYFNNLVVESDHTYGAAANGWLKMEPRVDSTDEELDSDLVYYYFDNGKMVTGSKYIDKTWYYFDGDGILRESGWNKIEGDKATDSVSAPGNVAYSDANGAKLTGWQYVPDKNVDGSGVDTYASYWFHLDKKGVRFYPGKFKQASKGVAKGSFPGKTGTVSGTVGLAKINGKFYLFDEEGRMLSGIYKITQKVTAEVGSNMELLPGTYYFSDDDWVSGQGKNGAMAMNSKHTVTNEYGDQTNYYFQKTGMAYANAIVSNVCYGDDGARVDAEDDYKVVAVGDDDFPTVVVTNGKSTDPTVPAVHGDILVNSKGVAQKKKTIKDVGGYKTYYVCKLPTKNDVMSSTFKWAEGEIAKAAEEGAKAGLKKAEDEATKALTKDQEKAAEASGAIDAVKKVIENTDTTKTVYSGYEIIATMN